MIKEYSAGGLVLKDNQVLLIRNYKPEKQVDYWGFPKGHIEVGETTEEAAVREVLEETGIKSEILKKTDEYEYNAGINQAGEEVYKAVTYFLMSYLEGEISPKSGELVDAGWFDSDKALKKISFDNDKTVLSKALILKENITLSLI